MKKTINSIRNKQRLWQTSQVWLGSPNFKFDSLSENVLLMILHRKLQILQNCLRKNIVSTDLQLFTADQCSNTAKKSKISENTM